MPPRITATDLLQGHCSHRTDALPQRELEEYLAAVDGWTIENGKLCKSFEFRNYYRTLAFVNAIAYVIHAEDHHPELTVGYQRCTVRYDTHSAEGGKGGITENDFICAARIDAVFRQGSVQ